MQKTKKDIERLYNKLMKDVAEKDFYKIDLTNRVNCYTCPKCKHITKTKDTDAGVTPMFFTCEDCGCSNAVSSMYRDIAPYLQPTIEWYRPTLEQVLKMKNEGLVEHILMGGLDFRKIKN